MANRYWVGGTASWDGTAGTKWATTSGGAGGAAVPTSVDDVFFDGNSGANAVTIATGNTGAKSIDCTGFTGIIDGTAAITVSGSVTLVAGMTYEHSGIVTFNGTGTLTTAGKTFSGVTINGSGITLTLGDSLTIRATENISVISGTFDAATYNVTTPTFNSSGTSVRTVNMGSGLWTITGTGILWSVSGTNITFNSNTANILLSSTSTLSRTFQGGGYSYNKLTIGGTTGTNTTTITNVGTNFTELASTKTVAHTIQFSSNIGTIDTWSITGTSGNVVTVNSNSAGTQRSFSLTNITSGINYLAVQDINVLTTNKFYVGGNSTDNGNNTNVYFAFVPGGVNNLFFGSNF